MGTSSQQQSPWSNKLLDQMRGAGELASLFSRHLMDGIVWVGRGGKRIPFTIPTELRQTWGVNWTP